MFDSTWGLILSLAGGGGIALLGLILNKFLPDEKFIKWGNAVEKAGAFCGRWMTFNVSEWPYIGAAWNKVLEPFFILLLNLPARFFKGLTGRNGLLTDNPQK